MENSYSLGTFTLSPTSEHILKSRFPLHHSCRNGDIEKLSTILAQAQHSVLEEDNFYGWTPAHWAAYFGKVSCKCKCFVSLAHRNYYVIVFLRMFSHLA